MWKNGLEFTYTMIVSLQCDKGVFVDIQLSSESQSIENLPNHSLLRKYGNGEREKEIFAANPKNLSERKKRENENGKRPSARNSDLLLIARSFDSLVALYNTCFQHFWGQNELGMKPGNHHPKLEKSINNWYTLYSVILERKCFPCPEKENEKS